MKAEQLDQLVRSSLDSLAASQPAPLDLHGRSVAHGRRLRRRRRAVAASVAGCALLVVGAGFALVPGRSPGVSPGSSGLESLINRVGGLHETLPAEGFWFAEDRNDQACGSPQESFSWLAANGVTRVVQDGVTSNLPRLFPAHQFSWAELAALPTEPGALRARLKIWDDQPTSADPDGSLLTNVGTLLSESPASPSLRAALIQILAEDPDVRVIGPADDPLGRPGFALEWVIPPGAPGGPAISLRILLDPATGRMLAYRYYSDEAQGANVDEGGLTVIAAGPAADDHTLPTGGWAVPPSVPLSAPNSAGPEPRPTGGPSAADAARGCLVPGQPSVTASAGVPILTP
jgi:hypothetical protein